MGYVAFVLDEKSRQKLLNRYQPKHPRLFAHHVTLEFGVPDEAADSVVARFSDITHFEVLGYAHDEHTDCVVVTTANRMRRQMNGKPLHVTISVAEDSKPVQAGKTAEHAMAATGWMSLTGQVCYIRF